MPKVIARYCCQGAPTRRLYIREPGTKQYIPIGWWCPACKQTLPDEGRSELAPQGKAS